MKVHSATAGTLESSDIFVHLEVDSIDELQSDIRIDLESAVIYQFGDQIRRVIESVLIEEGITHVLVKAIDRGALDCTITARVRTAISRLKASIHLDKQNELVEG